MHFTILFLLILLTIVQSAPTASLDATTLLKNAQEAQKLNAQFQSADSRTATSPCTNGDTTCVKNAIATCVNAQFVASACPATQQCFALPSVKSNGTIIACTSEKSAQSLINASGATGDVTGSGSGASTSSINPPAASPAPSGSISAAAAAKTAMSIGADCITTAATPSTPTIVPSASVVTVTVTIIPSIPTTLPSVTQTLSPEQASSYLSSLLAQGGPTPTAEPDCSDPSSVALTSASATDTPSTIVILSTTPQSAVSKTLSSAPSSAAAIANGPGALPGYEAGGYSGY